MQAYQKHPFEEHRPYLFSIAYRMLGSVSDAEDMVQEAFARTQQTQGEVQHPRSYLSTVTTRLCMEHLRKAYVRRESYVGTWLPEPLVESVAPDAERTTELAEGLSLAFLRLLENLSPTERAVFLLREVFDYSYDEVASVVEKTPSSCRQIARRARTHIQENRPRFSTSEEKKQHLMSRFFACCMEGDMDGLLNVLSEDAILYSDGGGKVHAARRPIYGANKIARFFFGILKKKHEDVVIVPALINGEPGLLEYLHGEPKSAFTVVMTDEHIIELYSINNPDKIAHLPPFPSF